MIIPYVKTYQDYILPLPLNSRSHNVICKMGIIMIIVAPMVKVKEDSQRNLLCHQQAFSRWKCPRKHLGLLSVPSSLVRAID